MNSTRVAQHEENKERAEIALTGRLLLESPLLNKGSAFTEEERIQFGLLGLLPPHVSTIEEQLARTYENYESKQNDIERYIFLVSLQDRNETLFYRLVQEHITEMAPIIYTPTVGEGCLQYSHIYRRPRGLYISYPHRERIYEMLENAGQTDAQVIVVTDGERVLGLGDLGVGGMGIPVGKLSLYSLCAGINPATTLPILLDVGTDNARLLNDPLYLGWRHERVRGGLYDDFVEAFVEAVARRFPDAVLQWEDFSKENASRLLERYRYRLCTFNDDIQGTGAVTLAGLSAALAISGSKLSSQQVAILGAGSAGTGISETLVAEMVNEGSSEADARSAIWLIDKEGLLVSSGQNPAPHKCAQPIERVADWRLSQPDRITLKDVIANAHPTILIGTSGQPGAFSEDIVREMARHAHRPIIFPLSNPTSKSEAVPSNLLAWTNGRALIATGSPFPDVVYYGRPIKFGQCNNAFIFPGLGLGVVAVGARRITDHMFVSAARALSLFSPALREPSAPLYASLEQVRDVSRAVAVAVAREAQREGLADPCSAFDPEHRVEAKMWTPGYAPYKLKEV